METFGLVLRVIGVGLQVLGLVIALTGVQRTRTAYGAPPGAFAKFIAGVRRVLLSLARRLARAWSALWQRFRKPRTVPASGTAEGAFNVRGDMGVKRAVLADNAGLATAERISILERRYDLVQSQADRLDNEASRLHVRITETEEALKRHSDEGDRQLALSGVGVQTAGLSVTMIGLFVAVIGDLVASAGGEV
ncbi:hypothetical protein [Agromyces binzhouensis]|uniref:Uncharacterized protein n=1 Tax=Agromyces binzhouensis TaxID=1817495 RepID=A0A4V1QS21_9MICO|nr:hypothetical protein [Agromyces binzhouensis]RXZ46873.1 hypothetical protein ESO86_10520 [Agromyces binzhouensis]